MNINNLSKKPILIEAPIWKRAFAFFIDYFILSTLVLFPFDNLLSKIIPSAENINSIIDMLKNNAFNSVAVIWITSMMAVIAILYFALFESKYAQTPGKMLMRIFAVTIKSNKKQLQTMTFWQGVKRSIGIASAFVMPVLFLIDVIYMFFNKKRQRLFEKLSQTQTLQVDFI